MSALSRTFLLFLTCGLANAARMKSRGESATMNAEDHQVSGMQNASRHNASRVSNLPPAVLAATHDLMTRECAMNFLDKYTKLWTKLSDESEEGASELLPKNAFAKAQTQILKPKLTGPEFGALRSLTIAEDDGIDDVEYKNCSIGAPFLDCAESLPPSLWLQQRWAMRDIIVAHPNKWYNPFAANRSQEWDDQPTKMKDAVYAAALEMTSFSESGAKRYCDGIQDQPDLKDVRECVKDKLGMPELVKILEEQWLYEDDLVVLTQMAQWWNPIFKKQVDRLSRQLANVKERSKSKQVSLKKHWWSTLEEVHTEQVCRKLQQSGSTKTKILERAMEEVMGVCDKDNGCKEKPEKYCPAGYACDCQKAFMPGRATKALVGGMVAGLLPAFLVACSTDGAIPLLHVLGADLAPGFIAAAMFGRRFFPKSRCFMKPCAYDEREDHCSVQPTKTMTEGSNPWAHLPGDGLKCVPTGTDRAHCELLQCAPGDAAVGGPKAFLRGRMGLHDGGTYNCVNTDGHLSSLLSNQEKVPHVDGTKDVVENSPAARSALLSLHCGNEDKLNCHEAAAPTDAAAGPVLTEEEAAKQKQEQEEEVDAMREAKNSVDPATEAETDEKIADATAQTGTD